jgi:hypothetical protein
MSPFLPAIFSKFDLEFELPGFGTRIDEATGNVVDVAGSLLCVKAHLYKISPFSRQLLPGVDVLDIALKGYLVTPNDWPNGDAPAPGATCAMQWQNQSGTFTYRPDWIEAVAVTQQMGTPIAGAWRGGQA